MSPYPRWITTTPFDAPVSFDTFLRQRFPSVAFHALGKAQDAQVLIAGCGTGQQALDSASSYAGRFLAIDLSLASLSYAQRKTQALGLHMIDYAQADILKLGTLGSMARTFDVIESVGVLHHLADPFAGWRVLRSLLKPGGFMRIGLYSELARQGIVRARKLIAERGYEPTAEGIRNCRQELISLNAREHYGIAASSSDFFSTSTCRDLLFHVQEHRMTLPSIEGFLLDNKLQLLGFDLEPHILHAYRQRFPEDPTATNLSNWNAFEHAHPNTFSAMYQIWVQATE